MSDRARELLERLLSNWEHPCSGRFGDLFDEVRAYLADTNPSEIINSQEVDRSEPVAWTNRHEINALTEECTVYMYAEPMEGEDDIPLYLHPAPRKSFVRLSEEEVDALMARDLSKYEMICAVENQLWEKNT